MQGRVAGEVAAEVAENREVAENSEVEDAENSEVEDAENAEPEEPVTLSALAAAQLQEQKDLKARLKRKQMDVKNIGKRRKRVMDSVAKLSDEDIELAKAERATPKAKARAAAKAAAKAKAKAKAKVRAAARARA